jgi:hypothetical protein|tara:strand:+ start:530 stop:706 length:177 start_codon:yes stop_codon:yes gene_type:complete
MALQSLQQQISLNRGFVVAKWTSSLPQLHVIIVIEPLFLLDSSKTTSSGKPYLEQLKD